ncbi:MAG: septum formation initiator family protein [Acidobacteria bacterium]|nr:septum formation initiator family protein [Acidobacteriota bacterium]
MKVRQIRVLTGRQERVKSLARGADNAEAWAVRVRDRAQPFMEQLLALRTRLATIAVALLAIWLMVHVVFGANGMVIYRSKRSEYRALEKEINQLHKENDDYTKQVNQLKSDPKRIEKEAREQFHYARPGEVIYVSPEAPAMPPPSNRSASK